MSFRPNNKLLYVLLLIKNCRLCCGQDRAKNYLSCSLWAKLRWQSSCTRECFLGLFLLSLLLLLLLLLANLKSPFLLVYFSTSPSKLLNSDTPPKFPNLTSEAEVSMDVIGFCNSPTFCLIKSNTNLQLVGYTPRPSCSFEGNQRKVVAMASTIPVEQVNKGPQQLTGDSFIREHLRKLAPYQPILPFEVLSSRLGRKPEDIVKLDANENPYGPPPEVLEALGSIRFPYVYPDPESRRLRAALAQDSGLESDYILAGCGADELIDLIMRCVLDPGDKIVDCPPTFTMYEFDAAVNGAHVIKVPRKADFSLNVEHITEVVKQENPKCIFLTSPNNPDGSIIDDEVLLKILDLPILVVLDEAYIEFSGIESRMTWVKKHENLLVLRTFSKRAGLAGLRVGYGAFPLSIIEYLWRAKQPYNVSVAAELSACAALQNPTYLENVKEALVKERERLYDLLKEVPFLQPFPSYSNFILCEVASGMDAKKLKEDLAQMGVMIRHYNNKELKGYVRVSVGKPEHTDALMKCLRKFF